MHKCPDWCHKCPDIEGHIMPVCWGTVAFAHNEDDLSHCNCEHISRYDQLIRETTRLIDKWEVLAMEPGSPVSYRANLQSLKKLRDRVIQDQLESEER
jgi:hypothetical protein